MTTRAEYLALAERAERAEASEAAQIIREAVLLCGKEEALTLLAVGALLDAALSLVPQGWGWHVDYLPPQTPWASLVRGGVMRHDCHGATPALALVAAALRARAEEAKDGE
jgi:hypothetical protein